MASAKTPSKPPARPLEGRRATITRWVGSTLVFVQNDKSPSEKEWDEFLGVLADNRGVLPKLRLLVITAGGAPTPAQRKRLADTLAGTPLRVASVSDSMKIRFVTATIALFHSDMRTFTNAELDRAYDYLALNTGERRLVDAALRELKAMVQ